MKKLRHSKFKNTGILFEMLVRQIAADTLNNKSSKSIDLIKKYFKQGTELSKELELYQTLVKEKFNSESKATQLLEAVVASQKHLNQSNLNKQKYNLIREIQKNYILEDFFKATVSNYKELASIYKVFEYNMADNPADITRTRHTIIEHISAVGKKPEVAQLSEFSKQDKDIRLLTYKLLVDKFNTKYSNLDTAQKNTLREYINNVNNTVTLKSFVSAQVPKMQALIKKYSANVTDKVTKIKLAETISLLEKLKTVKVVKDNHILSMLRYYELIKELKKV